MQHCAKQVKIRRKHFVACPHDSNKLENRAMATAVAVPADLVLVTADDLGPAGTDAWDFLDRHCTARVCLERHAG